MGSKKGVKDSYIGSSAQTKESKLLISPSIFRKNPLSILEAVVKFLKEDARYTYHEIGVMLNRDERNIWTVYDRARKKQKKIPFSRAEKQPSDISIPLSVLKERKLCTLEGVSTYLKKSHNLNYHEIGLMLDRDERNIWTVYHRAKKKLKNE